ncbi:MAG: FAD-dependent oxidoreductase [Desulfobacterales bacterium]|nr:FAD-dependent oxidoreductase [Desulfobacterales bacterium]
MVAGLAPGEAIVNPDTMFPENCIEMIVNRVEDVDAEKKQVRLADGGKIPYDKLVLGMGSRPVVPPIEGTDLDGVFTMRSLTDAERIHDYMEQRQPVKLVFVGAGFISLEVAALVKDMESKGFEVDVIELMDQPLPLMLDPELGATIQEHLVDNGIRTHMGRKVERLVGKEGHISGVQLDSGETLAADMVFMNVGTRPNLELTQNMGLEMGKFGIRVNEFLETANPDVLAAGDCIDNYHFITKKPVATQLRGPAVIQGRLVAKRLAGYEIPFPGLLGNSAVKLFDKHVAATGFTETQAQNEGFKTICATVQSRSKHGMIPGMKPWTLKLVFDKATHKLLGGQIISDDSPPAKEIDAINALIVGEKTISELTTFMCAGNPDCSSEPSAEPITLAAEQALQKAGQAV